jgi:hypothetical protein
MNDLNPIGKQFADALARAQMHADERVRYAAKQEKVHVIGAGRTLTTAYEQLRNAAEYTEEELLLQRAIRRFYKRLFMSRDEKRIAHSGEELTTELTLAGYIPNDHLAVHTVDQMSRLAAAYYGAYQHIVKASATQSMADEWTTALLAVEVEALISDHGAQAVFAQFAYEHFLSSINKDRVFTDTVPADYDIALLIAIYRVLLKTDNATIRWMLLGRYQQRPEAIEHFVATNKQIDKLIDSPTVDALVRVVNRRGAPLRVLWRMVNEVEDLPTLIGKREQFLNRYEEQINTEYRQMNKRINKGIVKSVIFLIITKFLIGLSVEVPYDYMVHGGIVWLPLVINLFFPPVYMVLLRLTLTLPGQANTRALTDRIDSLFYASPHTVVLSSRDQQGQYTGVFNSVYGFLMVILFGLVAWGLWTLGFSALHLMIFFVFLSTASFLGFRLSRMIREIEAVDAQQNGLTLLRDFLYLPFVVVGRWMSEKYARINIVALVLDMLIELPLKTVIRLVQQWGIFISSKKDEL